MAKASETLHVQDLQPRYGGPPFIDVVGSYVTEITVAGSYVTEIPATGSYVTTIDVLGSVE
jgi:hypothetical protein